MDPREWLFDKRVVRRNLDKSVLTIKTLNDYFKTLPDLKDEYNVIEFETKDAPESAAEQEGKSETESTAD